MILFEEARTLHDGLQYDSIYSPRARLKAPIQELAQAIDKAIELLGTVEIIVIPWEHAMPFQRQWESTPGIKSVRDKSITSTSWTEPWLWGHFITYLGIDCLASCMTQSVVVSGVRDLRKAYAPEDRIVLIAITDLTAL